MTEAVNGLTTQETTEEFPDDMSLQWRVAEAMDWQMLGQKGHTFALGSKDGKLYVIGDIDDVEVASLFTSFNVRILERIRELGGSFKVEGNEVICKIRSTFAAGPDYLRAGMLALAKHYGK